jgi:peptide-methionine (S)-S-oxide reductase
MKKIVLAGGCFWGVEAYFSQIEGVVETSVGYANGTKVNPTYEEVCTGQTGHAEVCEIGYNETVITLETLLSRFWRIIDPTMINRQGPDIGHQYRTGIFFIDKEDLPIIQASTNEEAKKYKLPIMTELLPLQSFYAAEEYHQKYLKKNPNGYCHINLNA